ncbi:MAG: hypothetical protein RLZZ175_2643 [Bacteroidota bacterium]|jgi:acetyltransferase-like isoleucine patch superfamily enzyme
MKSSIIKLFAKEPLEDFGFRFHLLDFIFRKLLFQNPGVSWPIHFTSRIIHPEKIKRGIMTFPGGSMGNYIQAQNGIEIGDYTNLGPNVGVISVNHNPSDITKHLPAKPIKIGKYCWVGMNAVILAEVELGDHTIVGANSVVTKSFPEGYCVIAGNPAKVIRTLDKSEILNK